MRESAPLVSMTDVSFHAGGRRVLDSVSFSRMPGEIITIVGPNDGGKTTLLRIIIGALRPSSGDFIRKRGLRIGYMPQKLALDPSLPLDVQGFLSLGLSKRRDGCRDITAVLAEAGLAGREGALMPSLAVAGARRAGARARPYWAKRALPPDCARARKAPYQRHHGKP